MEARIREIGGRTVLFFFNSPSPDFLRGCFSSIKETVSTPRRAEGFASSCAGSGRAGVFLAGAGAGSDGFAADSTFAFFSTFGFAADLGESAALTSLRGTGFFVAVLLFVFVAIGICENLLHGSTIRAILLSAILSMYHLVNFARLSLVDGENVYKIFHVRIAQSL